MNKKKIEYEESSGNVFADLGLPNPEQLLEESKLRISHDLVRHLNCDQVDSESED